VLDTSIFDRTGSSGKDVTENRRIKINYPGTGNNSQFTYDGFGHTVEIVETLASTVTSTKQFVWASGAIREARNATGSVTAQYFRRGQTISGTNYFYTKDHLGSIREMTDGSGNTHAAYSYDSYGRATKTQGALSSDFTYAGYYFHAPSSLSLTVHRAYSSAIGRWINRDPIEEKGGINLYAYVRNEPTMWQDRLGEEWPTIGDYATPFQIGLINSGVGLWLGFWSGIDAAIEFPNEAEGDDGPEDAYRHCLWSCRMAQAMGTAYAEAAANNHEWGSGDTPAQTAMDQKNNAAGRAAASGTGSGGCECKCKWLLNNGGLTNLAGRPMGTGLTGGYQAPKE
jgi:RHS repeat-associated protein